MPGDLTNYANARRHISAYLDDFGVTLNNYFTDSAPSAPPRRPRLSCRARRAGTFPSANRSADILAVRHRKFLR